MDAAAAVEEALRGDDCKGKGRDALIISLPSFSKDLGHLSLSLLPESSDLVTLKRNRRE